MAFGIFSFSRTNHVMQVEPLALKGWLIIFYVLAVNFSIPILAVLLEPEGAFLLYCLDLRCAYTPIALSTVKTSILIRCELLAFSTQIAFLYPVRD